MGSPVAIDIDSVVDRIQSGEAVRPIARSLGVSPTTVYRYLDLNGYPRPKGVPRLSAQQQRKIMDLLGQGVTHENIARMVHCTAGQVDYLSVKTLHEGKHPRPAIHAGGGVKAKKPKRSRARQTVEIVPAQVGCPKGHSWADGNAIVESESGALLNRALCKKCLAEKSRQQQNARRAQIGLPQIPKEFAA